MPIDYSKYPPNWNDLRQAVLKRAGSCCEVEGCGVKNGDYGYRTLEGKFIPWKEIDDALENNGYDYFDSDKPLGHCWNNGEPTKGITIVITVAHLDHDETNHNVKIERLQGMCQYHHLNYDKEEKARRRKEKKKIIQPELPL